MNNVGMPAAMLLDMWCRNVNEAFDGQCYLVGSATQKGDWRDVDVRLILTDEVWERWFPGLLPITAQLDITWVVLCTALSQSASVATGLPVDFQIQQMTYANEKYAKSRSPLGLVRMRR